MMTPRSYDSTQRFDLNEPCSRVSTDISSLDHYQTPVMQYYDLKQSPPRPTIVRDRNQADRPNSIGQLP